MLDGFFRDVIDDAARRAEAVQEARGAFQQLHRFEHLQRQFDAIHLEGLAIDLVAVGEIEGQAAHADGVGALRVGAAFRRHRSVAGKQRAQALDLPVFDLRTADLGRGKRRFQVRACTEGARCQPLRRGAVAVDGDDGDWAGRGGGRFRRRVRRIACRLRLQACTQHQGGEEAQCPVTLRCLSLLHCVCFHVKGAVSSCGQACCGLAGVAMGNGEGDAAWCPVLVAGAEIQCAARARHGGPAVVTAVSTRNIIEAA